jgi:hypothetical protein
MDDSSQTRKVDAAAEFDRLEAMRVQLMKTWSESAAVDPRIAVAYAKVVEVQLQLEPKIEVWPLYGSPAKNM